MSRLKKPPGLISHAVNSGPESITRIPYRIFLFTIIFSPLAFGTVEPWSLFIMEGSAFLALCILLVNRLRIKEAPFHEVPGIIPLMLLLAYLCFQLVPLPPDIVRLLSPGSFALYQDTVWTGQPGQWISLSINKKASASEFFRFASYAVIYILAVQLLAEMRTLKKTVTVIVVFGSVLAFFAIIQHLLPNNRIYWIRELTQGGTPFGPYVNRNHYAGLMGMIFPLILSLFLHYRPRVRHASFRKRLINIFSDTQSNISLLLGFSAVLAATSVFLSLSRGGIASLIMSLVFLGFLIGKRQDQGRKGLLFAATIIVILYAVGWFGWGPVFERFQSIRNTQGEISELRLDIWKDSLQIIRDFPLTGTGFGSFINIYPSYRTIQPEGIADHAHNDYIELFTNGGAIAVLLLLWFTSIVVMRSFRVIQRRKESYSLFLYFGVLTGIFSILLHSITDFNLQIGANGLYLFLMLGLAVSAAHTGNHKDSGVSLPGGMPGFSGKRFCFAVSFALLLICATFYAGRFLGSFLHSEIRRSPLTGSTPREHLLAVSDTLGRASFFDPLEPEYHYRKAIAESLSSNDPAALRGFRTAVRLDPANSVYLQSLGLFLGKKGDDKSAEILLKSGIARDRTSPGVYKRYAAWLIEKGRRSEGLEIFKSAISLGPSKTGEAIAAMVLAGLGDEEIRRALPEETVPFIIFANYLEKTGKDEMAADAYMTALSSAGTDQQTSPASFHTAYHYFMRKQLFNNASSVMKKAAELFPRDPLVRLRLAEAYEKEQLKDKALEQYHMVIKIDPKNAKAGKKIKELE
jgi:O-antigen ligase/Tfp pilus assembly protein PilF